MPEPRRSAWERIAKLLLGVVGLIAVVGWLSLLVWSIVHWNIRHGQWNKSQPDRTFTVVHARSEPPSCSGDDCWYDYTQVEDAAGRTYRFDGHFVKVGDRCTTDGLTDRIVRCRPDRSPS